MYTAARLTIQNVKIYTRADTFKALPKHMIFFKREILETIYSIRFHKRRRTAQLQKAELFVNF